MGCDSLRLGRRKGGLEFQSTHPHGVRLSHRHMFTAQIGVSIHAPTWGATPSSYKVLNVIRVSIHAPTWGATKSIEINANKKKSFNPRTHMGCDRTCSKHQLRYLRFNPRTHMGCDVLRFVTLPFRTMVSIHAPTWGATKLT